MPGLSRRTRLAFAPTLAYLLPVMRPLYRDSNLQLIFGVTLMVVLGVSSIIPVLPNMMRDLAATPAEVGLVLTVFTLPGMLLAPVSGVLADRLGRKAVLVPSLFVFAIFGAACAFADSFQTLLALRFLQGLGAGPLGVLAMTLIGDLYQGRDLATAMGYNSGVLSFGTAVFPAAGGILGLLGWHAPFILPLVALPLGWAVMQRLDVPRPEQDGDFTAYLRQALGNMRRRDVLGLFAATLVIFLLLYGPLVTFYPLLLSQRFSASPLTIGLLIASASLFSATASSQLGRLSARFAEARLITCGGLFYAVCFGITPLMPSAWWLLLPLALFGLAQGLCIPTTLTIINRIAPPQFRGGYMAVNGTLLRLGQTIAPLIVGGVHALFGLNAVFWFGATLALTLPLLMLVLVGPGLERRQALVQNPADTPAS